MFACYTFLALKDVCEKLQLSIFNIRIKAVVKRNTEKNEDYGGGGWAAPEPTNFLSLDLAIGICAHSCTWVRKEALVLYPGQQYDSDFSVAKSALWDSL